MAPPSEPNPIATESPTPEQVLRWIAAAPPPWFPSSFAKQSGIVRGDLDAPLNELRSADMVKVVEWVRGAGQGYALTPEGERALTGARRIRESALTAAAEEPIQPPAAPLPLPEKSLLDLRPPIVAPVLVMVNLLWFFIGIVIAWRLGISLKTFLLEGDRTTFTRLGAVASTDLLRGEWWRLASCCFVHGSIWHLLINLFNLGMVGSLAELLWSRWRVLVIFLLSGFAGSCLAMALEPSAILVGASGAIWGLSTSVAAWMVVFYRHIRRDVAVELSRRLMLGFALNIAVSLLPGVSWQAHLGGAAAGFAVALLVHVVRARRGARRIAVVAAVASFPALCAGGLLVAIKYGDRWAPYRQSPAQAHPDPSPLLNAIQPNAARAVIAEAGQLLLSDPSRRKPQRVADVRGKVAELWSQAVEASRRLSYPYGDPERDATRVRAQAFANAQSASMKRLLDMIDSNARPEVGAWKAWGDSRREADRLWREIATK
jgi:rhomboid protease GluP